MALGEATQDISYSKPPPETLIDLAKALAMIGKVKHMDSSGLEILGSCKYGLQVVKIKATVMGNETGSTISLQALSDDIYAAGAKNGLKRLQETLNNVDNPAYTPNRSGISLGKFALRLVIFLVILLAVLAALFLGYIPSSLQYLVYILGAGIFVYFVSAMRNFGK